MSHSNCKIFLRACALGNNQICLDYLVSVDMHEDWGEVRLEYSVVGLPGWNEDRQKVETSTAKVLRRCRSCSKEKAFEASEVVAWAKQ